MKKKIKTNYNFKLINNYLIITKFTNLENLLKKLKIYNYLLITEKDFLKFETNFKNNLLNKNKYYILNLSNVFIKEHLSKLIKIINSMITNGYKIILLGPNKSLSSLFNYILIDKSNISNFPFLEKNINKNTGLFKNCKLNFYLNNINIYLCNKINKKKIYELYYLEGINIYLIKDKRFNNFILLNDKNVKEILKSIFIYHPLLSEIIKPFKLNIEKISIFSKNGLKDIEVLLQKIEKYNYLNNNLEEFFKHLINILNVYNVDIQSIKLKKLSSIEFKKIK